VANPLLVIDGPAVLYRAFFALPDSITDDDGHPVNALLGSVNQTLLCVERYDPRAVRTHLRSVGSVGPKFGPSDRWHARAGGTTSARLPTGAAKLRRASARLIGKAG